MGVFGAPPVGLARVTGRTARITVGVPTPTAPEAERPEARMTVPEGMEPLRAELGLLITLITVPGGKLPLVCRQICEVGKMFFLFMKKKQEKNMNNFLKDFLDTSLQLFMIVTIHMPQSEIYHQV